MAGQRCAQMPEFIDTGRGLEPAMYFEWQADLGSHFCSACQKPCVANAHLASKNHRNQVWWWLKEFNPGWSQAHIQEIMKTIIPNLEYNWGCTAEAALYRSRGQQPEQASTAVVPPPPPLGPPPTIQQFNPCCSQDAAVDRSRGQQPEQASTAVVPPPPLGPPPPAHLVYNSLKLMQEIREAKAAAQQAAAGTRATTDALNAIAAMRDEMVRMRDEMVREVQEAKAAVEQLVQDTPRAMFEAETTWCTWHFLQGEMRDVKGKVDGMYAVLHDLAAGVRAEADATTKVIKDGVDSIKDGGDSIKNGVDSIKHDSVSLDLGQIKRMMDELKGEVMALKGVVMTLDEGHMMETINGKSEAASPPPVEAAVVLEEQLDTITFDDPATLAQGKAAATTTIKQAVATVQSDVVPMTHEIGQNCYDVGFCIIGS